MPSLLHDSEEGGIDFRVQSLEPGHRSLALVVDAGLLLCLSVPGPGLRRGDLAHLGLLCLPFAGLHFVGSETLDRR